ncbi:MAG: glycosyltransferase family 4 protein [Chloroflexota bacterium]|nr:glycosyltransferase family 4 protein [Chloroflexota bacterium]
MRDNLRIGIVVPPMLPVPPKSYAGTERVVACLVDELCRRGHQVTLFAAGDSQVDCELVPVIRQSLWSTEYRGDVSAFVDLAVARIWREHDRFDVIHSHAEAHGLLFARYCPTPVISTLHGRLDVAGVPELLDEFRDVPLVSISDSQRRWHPNANWLATVHHGLPLGSMPFGAQAGDYLAFVGRVTREKGVEEAVELARRVGLPLRMAAKVYDEHEQAEFAEVVQPAIDEGVVEFLGELAPHERDPLLAGARATLMLGAWPEPFGLVAIESMGTGTPVIARRAGGPTETVDHGVDGFLVDDLDEAALAVEKVLSLDRADIRRRALERYSPQRMVEQYESIYRQLIGGGRKRLAVVSGASG